MILWALKISWPSRIIFIDSSLLLIKIFILSFWEIIIGLAYKVWAQTGVKTKTGKSDFIIGPPADKL